MKSSYIIAAIIVIAIIVVAAIVATNGSHYNKKSTSTISSTTVQNYTTASSSYPTTTNTTTTVLSNTTNTISASNSSQNTSNATGIYTVKIQSSPMGNYLVNETGWSLYIYMRDTPYSGNSACYGTCAGIWHPFYSSNLIVQPGINISKFGSINRTDGSTQLTYNGYPLYYYSYDTKPGDTKGEGFLNLWYLVSPQGQSVK